MTRFENLAQLFPLHLQRIVELTTPKELLAERSDSRWFDLACLFSFCDTSEGFDYWFALANGGVFARRGIEVTPAMIEAGVAELTGSVLQTGWFGLQDSIYVYASPDDLVRRVYMAMASAT